MAKIILVGAFVLFIAFLQTSSQNLGDPDGFYHSRMATILKEQGLINSFPWLTKTVLADKFADQHFLYHVLLIPFVEINPIVGVNIFNIIVNVLVLAIFYFALKQFKIPYPLFWAFILFFMAPYFFFRLQQTKAVGLSLLFLLLSVILIKKNQPWPLFLVAFAFTWTYGGFVFLPGVVLCYAVSKILYKQPVNWKLVVFPIAGIVAAVILHPFPHITGYLYQQIFQGGLNYKVPVAQEWGSPGLIELISALGAIIILWIIGVIIWVKKKTANADILFLFLASSFFLLLTLKSLRFAEYSAPFCGLFAAVAIHRTGIFDFNAIKAYLKNNFFTLIPVIFALIVMLLTFTWRVAYSYNFTKNGYPAYKYFPASKYLKNYSKPGDIVFNVQWNTFSLLFFWNDQNYYIAGLDPTFMYIKSESDYWLYRHILDDQLFTCPTKECTPDNTKTVEDTIRNNFQAKYVFVETAQNPQLDTYLLNNPAFKLVYSDLDTRLYKVN